MKNKTLKIIITVVASLLLIPFIAMQFTNEVNWSVFDFLVMGVLLTGVGVLFDVVLRKVTNKNNRIAIITIIIIAFLLVWAELAVGIFGTPLAGS